MLARYANVPYRAGHELDHGDRHDCGGDTLGRHYLDKPRTIDFKHDTLLASIKAAVADAIGRDRIKFASHSINFSWHLIYLKLYLYIKIYF